MLFVAYCDKKTECCCLNVILPIAHVCLHFRTSFTGFNTDASFSSWPGVTEKMLLDVDLHPSVMLLLHRLAVLRQGQEATKKSENELLTWHSFS